MFMCIHTHVCAYIYIYIYIYWLAVSSAAVFGSVGGPYVIPQSSRAVVVAASTLEADLLCPWSTFALRARDSREEIRFQCKSAPAGCPGFDSIDAGVTYL